ncbi:MAG: M14 family metallocarboxypeptidase [Psychromonas sp.]
MNTQKNYPIGLAGKKWADAEKQQWREAQQIKRSYKDDVLDELQELAEHFELIQYGELRYGENEYPLFVIKSRKWQKDRANVFISGGVHGYETSGVHGAIRFAQTLSPDYLAQYNFIIAPCVSPWGYETINRWNPNTIDPNRSFYSNSPAQEAFLLMAYINSLAVEFLVHIDLHETTDTDNSEFRPALEARDAHINKHSAIPDGFYLVGDTTKAQKNFQKAIINRVKKVTHIAPADQDQQLIGVSLAQFGVVNYAARELGLCMGLTDAPYVTTTEVYPDSPLVNNEMCINAQVAVICAALDYLNVSSVR